MWCNPLMWWNPHQQRLSRCSLPNCWIISSRFPFPIKGWTWWSVEVPSNLSCSMILFSCNLVCRYTTLHNLPVGVNFSAKWLLMLIWTVFLNILSPILQMSEALVVNKARFLVILYYFALTLLSTFSRKDTKMECCFVLFSAFICIWILHELWHSRNCFSYP